MKGRLDGVRIFESQPQEPESKVWSKEWVQRRMNECVDLEQELIRFKDLRADLDHKMAVVEGMLAAIKAGI